MPRLFKSLLRAPIYALILLSGISVSASAFSSPSSSGRVVHDPKVIDGIANELLNGLNEARMDEIFLISGSGRLSIDIVPFRPVNSENQFMPLTLSGELNTFLLATLFQKSQGKFRFHISRRNEDLKAPARRLQKRCADFSRTLCANPDIATTEKYGASNADIVILGRLVVQKGTGYLSYKAYAPETGVILAATTPRKINVRFSRPAPLFATPSNPPLIVPGEYLEPSRWKIFQLQKDLDLLGFRPGRINGYLTRQTRQAVRRYQWHHEMDPDGNISRVLLRHIRKQVVLSPLKSEISRPPERDGV